MSVHVFIKYTSNYLIVFSCVDTYMEVETFYQFLDRSSRRVVIEETKERWSEG